MNCRVQGIVVSGIPGFISPSFVSPLVPNPTKQSLRRQLRAYRRSLSPAQQRRAALRLVQVFLRLPSLKQSRNLALYIASDGEIDPAFLLARLLRAGKRLYVPRLNPAASAMQFVRFRPGARLLRSRLGVLQPAPGARSINTAALDLIALPLVGFDTGGNRLGMGGGFYDRLLDMPAPMRPRLVGLAHAGQRVARLPKEPWDVPLDWIATDQRLIRCPRVRRLRV